MSQSQPLNAHAYRAVNTDTTETSAHVGPRPALQRQDTEAINRATSQGSMVAVGIGVTTIVVTAGMAAAYIWYSTTVPKQCPTSIGAYFLAMGIFTAVSILPITCAFVAAVKLMSLASHTVIAEKRKAEGRDEEAAEEESKTVADVAFVAFSGGCTVCAMMCLMPVQVGMWIFGLVQAIQSSGVKECGSAATVFWILFLISVLTNALQNMQSCGASSSSDTSRGGE